jgi:3-keto-5-aminohexanoate cleavage enzyme
VADPVLIELRPNETAVRESGNPHVPYSPAEIAEQGRRAAAEGATILHWHARDPQTGEPIHTVQPYLDVIERVRADTELLLHPTLGYTSATAVSDRVAHLAAAAERGLGVDLAPVDFGSVDVDTWDPQKRRFVPGDRVYANTRTSIAGALGEIRRLGSQVVAVCWHPGHVRTALAFREAGLLPEGVLWEFPFTGPVLPAGAAPEIHFLQSMIEVIPEGEPWLVLCFGGDVLPLAAWAITLGGHVAIGTGDHHYERLGHPDNAALVARVVQMAQTLGREVASPAQARELLGVSQP